MFILSKNSLHIFPGPSHPGVAPSHPGIFHQQGSLKKNNPKQCHYEGEPPQIYINFPCIGPDPSWVISWWSLHQPRAVPVVVLNVLHMQFGRNAIQLFGPVFILQVVVNLWIPTKGWKPIFHRCHLQRYENLPKNLKNPDFFVGDTYTSKPRGHYQNTPHGVFGCL